MSSIKFNTLVVSTYEGEVLDVIVGTDIGILSQLKETQYWDDMLEESEVYKHINLEEMDVQSLSIYYDSDKENSFLITRVSYFPDKVVIS